MATPAEKSLNALLGSVQRIEKMLSQKSGSKNDKSSEQDATINPKVFSSGFKSMSSSLRSIEQESKTTNQLLKELIDINALKHKDIAKDVGVGAKNINQLTKSIPGFFKAINQLTKIPESSVDKFKRLIMLSAFIDPKTGKSIVTEKQLEDANQLMKNIHSLAGGVIKYGLSMAAFLVISPLAIAGATAFGFSLRMLDLALGKNIDTKRTNRALKGLKNLGIGIGIFGLAMVGFSYILPEIAKGALGFITVVAGLGVALWTMTRVLQWGSGGFKDTSPLNSLHKLGISIAIFGTTMALMSYAAPQIFLGAAVFTTVVAGLGLTIFILDKALGGSKLLGGGIKSLTGGAVGKAPGGKGPLSTLIKLGWSVAAFSASMILVGYFIEPFAKGALGVTLAIGAIGAAIQLLGTRNAQRGSRNLLMLSASMVVFTGAIALWANLVTPKFNKAEDLGMLAGSIGVMGIIGTLLGAPPLDKFSKQGSINLILLGASLATFAISLGIYMQYAKDLEWKDLGKLGATIGVMALIGTVLGIPAVAPFAIIGAGVLIALGASLAIFSGGMAIYANTVAGKMDNHDLKVLAGAIGVMALIGTAVGVVAPLVLVGSAALIVAGGALMTISGGLAIFAKSGFDGNDAKNLNSALRNTIAGFLGYESLDDVGLKALVKTPMIAGLLGTMSAAMVIAAGALLPITKSLKIFKEAEWHAGDSDMLKEVIGSVITAFTSNLKDVNWKDLYFGLRSLNNVGNVLTGLATGVSAFANLSFIEYDYDEKLGKLVPKNQIKLKKTDIEDTGKVIGDVIGAMVIPLSEFGAIFNGSGGVKGFFKGLLDKTNVEKGISSLANLGSGLTNLATGVGDWANLSITTWSTQKDPNTGLEVLVPKGKTKLEGTAIINAGNNIADVLAVLATPLSQFGAIFNGTGGVKGFFKGLFDKTSVEKGIASMASLGTGLGNMAHGVSLWGQMKYVPMTIGKNKETGLNELMPGKPIDFEIKDAGKNIASVLKTIATPLSNFGKIFSGGAVKGFLGGVTGKDVITGIEQMGIISNNLGELGKMIGGWNTFSYTEMEVKDGKLVPKKVHPLGKNAIETAKENILSIIEILPKSLSKYNEVLKSVGIGSDDIGSIIEEISSIQNSLGTLASNITEKWGGQKVLDSAKNYKLWLYEVADPIIGQMAHRYKQLGYSISIFDKNFANFNKPVKSKEYHSFTDKLIDLSKHAKDFKIFADSFDRMANSMEKFSKNFSLMNSDGIAAFAIWTDTLLKAVEIGKETQPFNNFLNSADSAANSAFKFGNKQLGFSDDSANLSQNEKKSVIDQTISQQDNQQAIELRKLNQTIASLHNEISTLKTIMSGTLDINIESVSPAAKFKLNE